MRELEPLIQALQDPVLDVRRLAAETLAGIGRPAIPALRMVLNESHGEARYWALAALVRIGAPAVPALCNALQAENAELSEGAARALVRVGPAAVPHLCFMLDSARWDVREEAAAILGRIGDAEAVEPLCRLLLDRHPRVRRQASESLVAIGKEAAAGLCRMIAHGRVDAPGPTELLIRIGAPAISALGQLLRSSRWESRMAAVKALGQIGDAEAVQHLLTALWDDDHLVRKRAVEALATIGDRGAVFHLIEALDDPAPWVRAAAAEALGELRDPRALLPLNERLKDAEDEVRWCAVRALARIPDARSTAPIVNALREGRVHDVDAALALGAIAQVDPVLELRAALPLLRRSLRPWNSADVGMQHAYRSALRRIEAATAVLKDLPVPAVAPTPPVDSLPLPATSTAPLPAGLPIPAEGDGVGAACTASGKLRASRRRKWLSLWGRGPEP